MRLIYLPLEPYVERYTWLMSRVGGWTETHFKNNHIDFIRVDGDSEETMPCRIETGSVLDAHARCTWAMNQVGRVINLLKAGKIRDNDVIYFEDFWHPGIESLFYIRELTGINFKLGCFIHAQSVDSSDFTYPMRDWMRPMEVGMSKAIDFIFTCSPILQQLCIEAGYDPEHIFKVGLPYNSTRLLEQLTEMGFKRPEKKEFVLFSSRFDSEKNPHFFMDLIEANPDIKFKLVKPRRHLSNDIEVVNRAESLVKDGLLEIVDTSDKLTYYRTLAEADVQFNCAEQDWVSWTLLEALTFGCKPLYPNHKDFPSELQGFHDEAIYDHHNLESASMKLRDIYGLDKPFNVKMREIPERHDRSWNMFLSIMGFGITEASSL